jgi:hypothetical protein
VAAAATASKKSTVKATTSKTKSSPLKGLQLSQAQWKAYTAASTAAMNAARTKIAINAAATRFRGYRLQSARATMAKYNAINRSVQAAAVAGFATRQTWRQSRLGHQNAALQDRIYADFNQHMTILGRLQYARSGEKKYVTAAVLRTVTQAQAVSYEKKIFGQAAKTAKKASKTTTGKSQLSTAQSAAISAAGAKAGLAAAMNPKAVKAACPALTRHDGPWLGDPAVGNCGPVAVANAMLYCTGHRMGRLMFRRLERLCGPQVTISEAFGHLRVLLRDAEYPVQLLDWQRMPLGFARVPGNVVGYRAERGQHAALSIRGNRVVSWGIELDFEEAPEEVWTSFWMVPDEPGFGATSAPGVSR